MAHYVGTIGESTFTAVQRARIRSAIGVITPADYGKRVYYVVNRAGRMVYQVESNEQREQREGGSH